MGTFDLPELRSRVGGSPGLSASGRLPFRRVPAVELSSSSQDVCAFLHGRLGAPGSSLSVAKYPLKVPLPEPYVLVASSDCASAVAHSVPRVERLGWHGLRFSHTHVAVWFDGSLASSWGWAEFAQLFNVSGRSVVFLIPPLGPVPAQLAELLSLVRFRGSVGLEEQVKFLWFSKYVSLGRYLPCTDAEGGQESAGVVDVV